MTSTLHLATGPVVLASVIGIHKAWAWVVIIGNAMAGVWSLAAHWFEALRMRALWWFITVVEVAIFIQVALGVWMYNYEKLGVPKFHMFYGFVAIIAVGILYSYRGSLKHRLYQLYGFGGLFLMGLGIRAMLVGKVAG
jgi:hypothetical protein